MNLNHCYGFASPINPNGDKKKNIFVDCYTNNYYLCTATYAEVRKGRRGWRTLMEGVYYVTLCSWRCEIWQFPMVRQQQSNGRCLCGYVYTYRIRDGRHCAHGCHVVVVYIHIGVGFSVARLWRTGRCQSLTTWDEQTGAVPTLFRFCTYRFQNNNGSDWGAIGH